MVPPATSCNTNSSLSLPAEDSNNVRDASFPAYLDDTEEKCVNKLAESSPNLSSLVTTPHKQLYEVNQKIEEGEIDVFGAEKYFNGVMEEESPRVSSRTASNYQQQRENLNTDSMKPKNMTGTPSIHSESSWNSRSDLLHNTPRNQPHRKTRKVHAKSLLASLGCNCVCKDKNSVEINEHMGENSIGLVHGKALPLPPIKTDNIVHGLARMNMSQSNPWDKEEVHSKKFDEPGIQLSREDCFSFPILNSKQGNLAVKKQSPQEVEVDTPRMSLEVFGSPILDKQKKALSLERRLNVLSWDAIPKVEENEIPANSNGMYNDTESDASSDLFEIESFSNNPSPFYAREASDGMSRSSCVTATTCYAPSEASIDWSVVTASAADYSVQSDSEELRSTAGNATNAFRNNIMVHGKTVGQGREMQKRGPGSLLGCKSQKAVRVAGDVYIQNGHRMPHRLSSESEKLTTGFDSPPSRRRQYAYDQLSLPTSHPGRSPHLLYIQ